MKDPFLFFTKGFISASIYVNVRPSRPQSFALTLSCIAREKVKPVDEVDGESLFMKKKKWHYI